MKRRRMITTVRAKGLHSAIRRRWGLVQPEGYGIVFDSMGRACSGSTYRTPKGLYCFDVRCKNGDTEILFSCHG